MLLEKGNPNERLFIAMFDGTGNDFRADPDHATNVARMFNQLESLRVAGSSAFHASYLAGPGTQENPITRIADGALGYTYQERLEQMYSDLVSKADQWKQENPDANIRVMGIGFSRGASQAAGFTNLLHERGIVDPSSQVLELDGKLSYTRHLAPPGVTPQAVALFDPVATGFPEKFDRRLAPSVVSGFQITALDEVRAKFRNDQIIAPGLSDDGRFLNVQVAGAHADIGGGYIRDGLARRSCNLMVDYCNALAPGVLEMQKSHEPTDPRLNPIHRSEEHMLIYQMDRKVDRSTPGGVNTRLAPDHIVQADGFPHTVKPLGSAVAGLKTSDVVIAPPNLDVEQTAARLQFIEEAEKARAATIEQTSRVRVLGNTTAAVATTLEVADAARDYTQLRNESNLAAAQASITRTTTTAGMAWMGFQVGARIGGTLGPWGALGGGTLGAAIGGVAGDKIADEYERRRIYTHKGSDGNVWTADPKQPEKGWTRSLPPLPGNPEGQKFTADPALADELNYKAVTKATELGMGAVTARNPLKLAARQDDPTVPMGVTGCAMPPARGGSARSTLTSPALVVRSTLHRNVPPSWTPSRARSPPTTPPVALLYWQPTSKCCTSRTTGSGTARANCLKLSPMLSGTRNAWWARMAADTLGRTAVSGYPRAGSGTRMPRAICAPSSTLPLMRSATMYKRCWTSNGIRCASQPRWRRCGWCLRRSNWRSGRPQSRRIVRWLSKGKRHPQNA
ncbi:DUF2235 domain-containing protein [Stenotrophomonas oahuensis]|uniref:DUF2235 domain-containing protein n=1 Tax=Stenotrophomonas oahuensis TaxID=3003271 RepID=A0ABY9YTL9_9GAMM|nr:DUF2235 domain-containing protein [Stenotrophomonas sp. A5586]WNH54289.1 DUF2235 domain-containing protein [Stenotrophomonas sp. A5586]